MYQGLLQPDAREDEEDGRNGGAAGAAWPAHLERLVSAYRSSHLASLHAPLLPSDTTHIRSLLSDWATFWSFTAVAVLMAQASMSMGVALACFSLDPSIGLTLLPVLTAPMVMFSGVLYERASVPSSLSWMSSISIINHGFALMLSLEAPALPPGEPAIALGFAGIDDSPEALRSHFLALVLILAASYIITYLGLTVRARYFIAI
ncbi:abc subfamily abcg [Nannochloropsis oceanica]